ncbi:helicase-associated domain-containing protein [Microbacterium sp. NPDC055357]
MVSDERGLATWLARRDDTALAETFAARGVSPGVGWHDFFDAAAALLEAASVDRALTTLPRAALIAAAAGDASPVPERLALRDDAGRPYAAVESRLTAAAQANPDAFRPSPTRPSTPTAGEAAAAERAFATSGALADVLLACLHAPLTRTIAGAVSAVDRRRLMDAGAVESPDELDELVVSASMAGLVVAVDREWVVTEAGDAWLEASTLERWSTIVHGLITRMPDGLRTAAGGIVDPRDWADAYPLDTDWPARARRLHTVARRWGLVSDDGTEPVWTTRLRAGADLDTAAFAAQLPAEIDRVYLQADLTAIAPGPLAPALDLRLRRIAHRESRAQASTYRFTAQSLATGLTEGETAASIRDFLGALSLTGIPQPLDYLVESTAVRHGLVRVHRDERTGTTRVESADAAILDAIAVDQALRPLGLIPEAGMLTSRVARNTVYWSLADARYPVIALDPTGSPESLHRGAPTLAAAPTRTPADTYAGLIGTLRDRHEGDTDAAWLGRELEQAVRLRALIEITVRLPDGSERVFALEASGFGGGRLRGLDRAADIERTLPVSHIVGVRPL